ncbi:hypothetical protein DOTSEDRAFT_26005 [Dothistroma septosporum NZE10]|uniref:Uncharacterized protein n=1 Tax=Dothistroma septosporum (strain NZE10 / CBS 128990) TaxID=675120 RepID=N1PM51_DOTSN|nr:hypothetical protein DOTSEDRAFT_26005 [Dothistroma septosporum NZE10]
MKDFVVSDVPKKATKQKRSMKKDEDSLLPEVTAKDTKRSRSTWSKSGGHDSKAKIRRLLSAGHGEDESVVVSRSRSSNHLFADVSDDEPSMLKRKPQRRGTMTSLAPAMVESSTTPRASMEAILPRSAIAQGRQSFGNNEMSPSKHADTLRRDSIVSESIRSSHNGLGLSSIFNTIEPSEELDK